MGYRLIKLTKNKSTKVDEQDFERFGAFHWCYGSRQYAVRSIGPRNSQKQVYMHRQIMNALPGIQVDHINGDSLDNRRANLRLVTEHQNHMNKGKNLKRKGFKGVYKTNYGRWYAQIMFNKKGIHLGIFRNPIDAALAYDGAAKICFGEYARLNLGKEGY